MKLLDYFITSCLTDPYRQAKIGGSEKQQTIQLLQNKSALEPKYQCHVKLHSLLNKYASVV